MDPAQPDSAREGTVRRLISLLSSKGNRDELLSRLKTPMWESKCRLIVKQEKEEEVESKVDDKAEDKRRTLESGRPAKSIRGTERTVLDWT